MMPCIPQLKNNAACPLNNRTRSHRQAHHIAWAGTTPAHNHIVSALALAPCRRGVVWSRRCRAYISVGGLLATISRQRASARHGRARASRGSGTVGALVPAGEVVL